METWEIRIFGASNPKDKDTFEHGDAEPILDSVVNSLREMGHTVTEAHIGHGAIRGGSIIKKFEESGASSESVELTSAEIGTIESAGLTAL